MSTELLYIILLSAFIMTGMAVIAAVGYALLTWCTVEIVAEHVPSQFRAAWALGNVRIAVQVGAA